MPKPIESKYVSVETASMIAKRTPRTIREWIKAGKVKSRVVGGQLQVQRKSVFRHMNLDPSEYAQERIERREKEQLEERAGIVV